MDKKRQYAQLLETCARKAMNISNEQEAKEKQVSRSDFIKDLNGTINKVLDCRKERKLKISIKPYDDMEEQELVELVEEMNKICGLTY